MQYWICNLGGLAWAAPIALGYLALYLVADGLAQSREAHLFAFTPWNAAPALSLALLVRFGPRWFPLALLASLLAGLIYGDWLVDWRWSIARAVVEVAACAGAAGLFRSLTGKSADADRLPVIAALLVSVAVAATGIATGWLLEFARSEPSAASGLAFFGEVILANVAAMFCLVPLATVRGLLHRLRWQRPTLASETVLQIIALAIVTWEVFFRSVNFEIRFFYLLFLPMAWITIRHGLLGAALGLAFVYLAPTASDRLLPEGIQSAAELQIRLSALAVTALLFGVMVNERRRSQERQLVQQNELAHFQRLNVGWEMASALGHELNQPLTAAMNYSQAAVRLLATPTPDVARATDALNKGIDQIELAGQTIHGLKNFMRKSDLQLMRVRVSDLVGHAFRLVSAEAQAANITLQANDMTALSPVIADQVQIVQVLVNLLRNAMQAISSADMPSGSVTVDAMATAEGMVISVADTGPGLDPQIAARLFEPFVTTKESGMGLGLAISKSILDAHAGNLRAEEVFRSGMVFKFTLPLAPAEAGDA